MWTERECGVKFGSKAWIKHIKEIKFSYLKNIFIKPIQIDKTKVRQPILFIKRNKNRLFEKNSFSANCSVFYPNPFKFIISNKISSHQRTAD